MAIILISILTENKPTAQAADADPSKYKSTNRQNPPLQ